MGLPVKGNYYKIDAYPRCIPLVEDNRWATQARRAKYPPLLQRDFDFDHHAGNNARECLYDGCRCFSNVRPVVSAEYNQRQPPRLKLLLIANAFVACDQHIETDFVGHSEQIPVGQLRPSPLVSYFYRVPNQRISKGRGHVMVEQNPHNRLSRRHRIT
jgi:hypothetical protein